MTDFFRKAALALAATTMTVTPMIAAEAQARPGDRTVVRHVDHDRHGNRHVTRTVVRQQHFNDRRWAKGQRFDRRYARDYRVIPNPAAYRLRPAPRGYHWVRSGNDAVLVAITSGIIGAVIAGSFR